MLEGRAVCQVPCVLYPGFLLSCVMEKYAAPLLVLKNNLTSSFSLTCQEQTLSFTVKWSSLVANQLLKDIYYLSAALLIP